jgi:hypothetical protein
MPACSFIVKRGDIERYEQLFKVFGSKVPVVWDRRRRQRRITAAPAQEERRRTERRGPPPASWRSLNFVVAD